MIFDMCVPMKHIDGMVCDKLMKEEACYNKKGYLNQKKA
jgi:hypothetical protein